MQLQEMAINRRQHLGTSLQIKKTTGPGSCGVKEWFKGVVHSPGTWECFGAKQCPLHQFGLAETQEHAEKGSHLRASLP